MKKILYIFSMACIVLILLGSTVRANSILLESSKKNMGEGEEIIITISLKDLNSKIDVYTRKDKLR